MAAIQPMVISSPMQLRSLWEGVINRLNRLPRWANINIVARYWRWKIPKHEQGNVCNAHYLLGVRTALFANYLTKDKVMAALEEGLDCEIHCRNTCYCWGFYWQKKRVAYYNFKAHLEEARMEFSEYIL